MGDCDSLYKSILSGTQCSPELSSELMSPITSLALSLHHATNLSSDTPVKRLSISSDTYEATNLSSDTPVKRLSISSDTSEDTSLCFNDSNSSIANSSIDASNGAIIGDIGIKGSTIMNTLLSPVISKTPLRFLLPVNKENEYLMRKAYSLPRCAMGKSPRTPLKEVQNKCNRTLKFISPKETRTPLKPTMFRENINANQSPKQIKKKNSSTMIFSSPKESNKENIVNLSPLNSSKPLNTSRKFSSLSFTDENSVDMDLLLEDDPPSENQPSGLSSLLSAPIKCSDRSPEFSFLMRRRSSFYKKNKTRKLKDKFYSDISMDKENTPPSSKDDGVMEIENSPDNGPSFFKRPLPPSQVEDPNNCKRRKLDASPFKTGTPTIPTVTRQVSLEPLRSSAINPQINKCKLSRSISESHVSIMKALNKSPTTNEKSTGDFSRPIALPIITGGKHPDIPSITSDTLVDLLKGKYEDTINSFKILDCRYPYEYEGGHIKDAVSWHNPQMVLDHLAAQKGSPVIPVENQKRDILIFHCEFSANRGPKAQRLLREKDRTASTNYPALHFPEMYLLEGGYKVFFQQYPELCTPQGYIMMADSKHSQDLRHFRSKSKSWANDNRKLKSKSQSSTGLRKLRL